MISIVEFLAKKHQDKYSYFPKDKKELINILTDRIREDDCNLNNIDISNVTDMSELFSSVRNHLDVKLNNSKNNLSFKNVDISEWDVSHVTYMMGMFRGISDFNCDISKWDVSNVKDIRSMFSGCISFDIDLEKWKVNSDINMDYMFYNTKLDNQKNYPSWFKGKK